jgi:uncharacterized protein (TIGR03435 family)
MRPALLLVLLTAVTTGVVAQTAPPSFEVASVRTNKSAAGPSMISKIQEGGRWTFTNVPLHVLVRTAYRVPDFLTVGAPDWIRSERYDIMAKASGDLRPGSPGAPPAHVLMLRFLLEERFRLKVHTETQEASIYALVVNRSDGSLGDALIRSSDDCEAIVAAEKRGERKPAAPGERPVCGVTAGPGRIAGGNTSLDQLAAMLEGPTNRRVINRTSLTGTFSFVVTWTPDQFRGVTAAPIINGQQIDPDGPSLMTAIREQLGLKLEASKGPVDVLVIDSVSRPTPD